MNPVLFPCREGIFSYSPAVRSTQFPVQWLPGALAPAVRRPEPEADHSPPSSAEVKNM
jgi:hypothetical protein